MKRGFSEMTPDDTVNQLRTENDRLKRLLQQQKTNRLIQEAREERQQEKYDRLVQIVTDHIERVKSNRRQWTTPGYIQWEMNNFLEVLKTHGQ